MQEGTSYFTVSSCVLNRIEKDGVNMKRSLHDTALLGDVLRTAVYDYWCQVFLSITTITHPMATNLMVSSDMAGKDTVAKHKPINK
ncbi:hypothetical protein Holit_03267 [Hollandina sp. SP2]